MFEKSICVSSHRTEMSWKSLKNKGLTTSSHLKLKLDKFTVEINGMYLTDKVKHWSNLPKVDFSIPSYFKIKVEQFFPPKQYGLVQTVLGKAGVFRSPT